MKQTNEHDQDWIDGITEAIMMSNNTEAIEELEFEQELYNTTNMSSSLYIQHLFTIATEYLP